MRHRDIQRQPREFRSRRYDVAARNLPYRSRDKVGKVQARHGVAKRGQVPTFDRCAQCMRIELRPDRFEIGVVPRLALGIAQRQHRAARIVEHGAALLIGRAHAQGGEAGRGAARARPVLPERHDFGLCIERVADRGRAAEHEAAIKKVRDHALGK